MINVCKQAKIFPSSVAQHIFRFNLFGELSSITQAIINDILHTGLKLVFIFILDWPITYSNCFEVRPMGKDVIGDNKPHRFILNLNKKQLRFPS